MMSDDAKQRAVDHIKNHVGGYPATTESLVQACNNMSEFTEEEKRSFSQQLPMGRTWSSPDEVLVALGWTAPAPGGMGTGATM